jgi:hypothetical protein
MQFKTLNICLDDVTESGVTLKKADISSFEKYDGQSICFTLNSPPREDLNTVLFKGVLYLIDKRDDNYFECIAMEFIKCQK